MKLVGYISGNSVFVTNGDHSKAIIKLFAKDRAVFTCSVLPTGAKIDVAMLRYTDSSKIALYPIEAVPDGWTLGKVAEVVNNARILVAKEEYIDKILEIDLS